MKYRFINKIIKIVASVFQNEIMFDKYLGKKDYIVSTQTINNILNKMQETTFTKVQYIGYADKNLILSLTKEYDLMIWDWFDRTNTSLDYWEGDDKEFCSQYPIPNWVSKDMLFATGMGVAERDILLLDMPLQFDLEEGLKTARKQKKLPELIILFGDADSSSLPNKYTWTFEDIWVGRIIE